MSSKRTTYERPLEEWQQHAIDREEFMKEHPVFSWRWIKLFPLMSFCVLVFVFAIWLVFRGIQLQASATEDPWEREPSKTDQQYSLLFSIIAGLFILIFFVPSVIILVEKLKSFTHSPRTDLFTKDQIQNHEFKVNAIEKALEKKKAGIKKKFTPQELEYLLRPGGVLAKRVLAHANKTRKEVEEGNEDNIEGGYWPEEERRSK